MVVRLPNSDKGEGVKVSLENNHRKQHPETLGGQIGKEENQQGSEVVELLGLLRLSGHHFVGPSEKLDGWIVYAQQSSLGTRSCMSVHILHLLVEAASGLVTG